MPHSPGRSRTRASSSTRFTEGWHTSRYRLSRSNPVVMDRGASSSSSRWISSRTSEVAVAVKAPTTGLWGSRSTKSGMFR